LLNGKKPEIKVHESVRVHIFDGTITIWDYSEKDDRNILLAFFAAAGVRPVVKTDSWCG
jgi:hypothetical protein